MATLQILCILIDSLLFLCTLLSPFFILLGFHLYYKISKKQPKPQRSPSTFMFKSRRWPCWPQSYDLILYLYRLFAYIGATLVVAFDVYDQYYREGKPATNYLVHLTNVSFWLLTIYYFLHSIFGAIYFVVKAYDPRLVCDTRRCLSL